jgi:hypothetical protein
MLSTPTQIYVEFDISPGSGGAFYSVSQPEGLVTSLAESNCGGGFSGFAVDSTRIYNVVGSCAQGVIASTLKARPIAGGDWQTLRDPLPSPHTESGPATSCAPGVFWTGQVTEATGPSGAPPGLPSAILHWDSTSTETTALETSDAGGLVLVSADDTAIYWLAPQLCNECGYMLYSKPLSGGTRSAIMELGHDLLSVLEVDPGQVIFWTLSNSMTDEVYRRDRASGLTTKLWSSSEIDWVGVYGPWLYWSFNNTSLQRQPLAGGPSELVYDGAVQGMTEDACNIYWMVAVSGGNEIWWERGP